MLIKWNQQKTDSHVQIKYFIKFIRNYYIFYKCICRIPWKIPANCKSLTSRKGERKATICDQYISVSVWILKLSEALKIINIDEEKIDRIAYIFYIFFSLYLCFNKICLFFYCWPIGCSRGGISLMAWESSSDWVSEMCDLNRLCWLLNRIVSNRIESL